MYSDADEEVFKEVSKRIESYADLGTLLIGALNVDEPVLNSVLNHLVQNPTTKSSLKITTILPLFDQICDRIGVTEITMIDRLNEFSKDLKMQLTAASYKEIIPSFRIYTGCLGKENEFSSHVWSVAKSYILNVDEGQWAKLLKDENCFELKLLSQLLKGSILIHLPGNLVEPYKRHLLLIAGQGGNKHYSDDIWGTLFKSIEDSELAGVTRNIRDGFITKWDITPELFKFFEAPLRITGSLHEKPEEVFRRIITPVTEQNICLDLITANTEFYLSLFSNAGNQKLDFIRAFRRMLQPSSNEQTILFGRALDQIIAKLIQVLEGKYYTDDEHRADVTQKLKQIIEFENTLSFKVDNGIVDGNDPHESELKTLTIKFLFDGKEYLRDFIEGSMLSIP
jgi:hypothetical protein